MLSNRRLFGHLQLSTIAYSSSESKSHSHLLPPNAFQRFYMPQGLFSLSARFRKRCLLLLLSLPRLFLCENKKEICYVYEGLSVTFLSVFLSKDGVLYVRIVHCF
jgi:hypothetical protein